MSDIRELYQEMIIDHGRSPRNFRTMDDCTVMKVGHNPLCGDKLVLFLKTDGDTVTDVAFQGEGCAISMASSSLMSQVVKGKTVKEALGLFEHVHAMVTDGTVDEDALGKLAILSGVNAYPARVKCASLAWQTLKAGLEGDDEDVCTE